MEVTNTEERNSSVVLSAHDSIAVTIDSSAELMHVLSSALYTNPRYAMVRETMCNAQDAHTEAGTSHMPIQVTLTETLLEIKDSGLGIPHELIGEIYGTFGKSTRKNNAGVTGGHGLGCKSPWSYVDVFTVTSCHAGTKTIYKMMKHDPEQDNKMGIKTVLQVPTSDTGLTVSINLNKDDYHYMLKSLEEVVKYGEMNVVLNGNQSMHTLSFSKAYKGISLMSHRQSHAYIRYGSVLYPLVSLPDEVETVRNSLIYSYNLKDMSGNRLSIIIQAEPNTLSVAPSRDNLTFDPVTTKEVIRLINKAKSVLTTLPVREVSTHLIRKAYVEGKVKLDGFKYDDLGRQFKDTVDNYYSSGDSESTFYHTYEDLSLIIGKSTNSIGLHNVLLKEHTKYLNKDRVLDLKLQNSIAYMDSHHNRTNWFSRYTHYPLLSIAQKLDARCKVRAFIPMSKATFTPDKVSDMYSSDSHYLLAFAARKVIITTRLSNLFNRLPEPINTLGTMVLSIPRDMKLAERAEQELVRRGYEVINLALNVDIPKHLEDLASIKSNKKVPKPVPDVKHTGYVSLMASYHYGDYNYSNALQHSVLITEPIAFIVIGRYESDYPNAVPTRLMTRRLNFVLGEKIAVVRTKADIKALMDAGVPTVMDYLEFVYVPNFMKNHRKELVAAHKLDLITKYSRSVSRKHTWVHLEKYKNVMKILGFNLHTGSSISDITDLLEVFQTQYYRNPKNTKRFACYEQIEKLKETVLTDKEKEKLTSIHSSPFFGSLNYDELNRVLGKYDAGSPQYKTATKLIKTVLQGNKYD